MDDEKCLDLSLGLPCGSNSSSQKGKFSNSSEVRPNEDDRDRKMINEFKNFLEGGNLTFGETYYGQYAKTSAYLQSSKSLNDIVGISLTSESRSTELVEEGMSFACEKRKNMFTEIDPKKKHSTETNHVDFTENIKASHISIGDEGSTAENEDVADSEADGSSSKHVPYNDDLAKQYALSGSIFMGKKDVFHDSQNTEINGQKRHPGSSEMELKITHAQPPTMSVPFSQAIRDLKSSGTLCLPSYSFPGIMDKGGSSVERSNVHPNNIPLTFGYSSAQLPTLDRDNSRGIIFNEQQIHPSFPLRNQGNSNTPVASKNTTQYEGNVVEHGKVSGKQQHIGVQEDSSSHTINDMHQAEVIIPSELQAIRPGMAADLKFGGSGSYPNLPWVSTTSSGPNGRTISGVTYRFSPTSIKIVCACHGSHMSPEKFIRHASEDNNGNIDSVSALESIPSNNPSASARS